MPNSLPLRFSLRTLLAAVAAVAVVVATLLNATPNVRGGAALVVAAVYAGAAIAAVHYRCGAGRAFAGGFTIAGLAYLVLVRYLLNDVEPIRPILPTSRALDAAYGLVVHDVPNPDYVAGLNMAMIAHPEIIAFRSIGHCCWSLLLGLFGGCVARRFAGRQGTECNAQPKADAR